MFSCMNLLAGISPLMGMSPAVDLCKVSVGQLPFNPFVPRVAWSIQKSSMVEALMPATSKAFSALAYTTLARRPMTSQAYVPKLKVLESALTTPCENVDLSQKNLTLFSLVAGLIKSHAIKSKVKPIMVMRRDACNAVSLLGKMTTGEPSFCGISTRDTIDVLVGGRAKVVSVWEELDAVAQNLIDSANDTSWNPGDSTANKNWDIPEVSYQSIEETIPEHEQCLLRDFDALARQTVECMKRDTSEAERLLGEYDKLARQTHNKMAAENNVVQWYDVSLDHQDLLVETGAIPMPTYTKKI